MPHALAMREAIGAVLPLGVGVAISPVPIIAAILLLLSPRAKRSSTGFLLGWLTGILVAVVVFALLGSAIPERDPGASRPVAGAIQIVLGVALLLLALRQWRSRPEAGEAPVAPKWMAAIDSLSFGKALGLGFMLAALNPKNLLLAVSAGVAIGTAGVGPGQAAVVAAVYTVLAVSTVAIPVLGYVAAAERLRGPLDAVRHWLLGHNAAIMAVLFLVLGTATVGKGIAAF